MEVEEERDSLVPSVRLWQVLDVAPLHLPMSRVLELHSPMICPWGQAEHRTCEEQDQERGELQQHDVFGKEC